MNALSAADTARRLSEHKLLEYDELPSFGVYADQLISYINDAVGVYFLSDEKLLTVSMVNNYVKHKVIPKPLKKKYSRDHIAYLIVLCVLKKVLSIQEISSLISELVDSLDTESSYNLFAQTLFETVQEVFARDSSWKTSAAKNETERTIDLGEYSLLQGKNIELMQKAVSSFANKLYVQINLEH